MRSEKLQHFNDDNTQIKVDHVHTFIYLLLDLV